MLFSAGQHNPIFQGFQGRLDGAGRATSHLNVPPIPQVVGLEILLAVTTYIDSPLSFTGASDAEAIHVHP